MPDMYNVEEQSQYHIKLVKLENLEDAGDEFMTEDELKEIGIENLYGRNETKHFNSKITDELNRILSSIKPGKKSAIIKDDILVEVLKGSYYPVSNWVDNTRRVGNRLFKAASKPEQSVPSFTNWKQLVNASINHLCNTYGAKLSINLSESNRVETIDLVKKAIDWEDLSAVLEESSYYDDEEIKWYKLMWEDSSTIPVVKGSK